MWLLRKIKYFILRLFFSFEEIVEQYIIPKAEAGSISTAELVNRIFRFCEIYSGRTMYPYQEQASKRVIRSVLENDGAEISVLMARQMGKSECLAVTVGGMMILLPQLANMVMFLDDPRLQMFKEGFWVGIFAPIQNQAQLLYGKIKSKLMGKTAQIVLNDPEFRLQFSTSNSQTVSLSNGSRVTSISASETSNIEGDSFMLLCLDECQDIGNMKITKSISPMGAAYNATMVVIGTPTTYKGYFYEAIQRNKKDIESKNYNGFIKNHFEFDYTVGIKFNPKYAKYIEGEKKKLGENSDAFRMSYKLEWVIERGMFVDISKFEKENIDVHLERQSQDYETTHVVGIDVGIDKPTTITVVEVDWSMPVVMESRQDLETGEDVVYTAYNSYIKDWHEIVGVPDYEDHFEIIMDYLSNFNVARLLVDATREAALAHRLRANLPYEVIPFVFSTKTKSEIYKYLLNEIDTERARVPGGKDTVNTIEYQKFIHQLGDLQKFYIGQYMTVSKPTDKDFDEYPDSWALGVWGCSMTYEPDHTETHKNRLTEKTSMESKSMKRRNAITARRR